MKKIFFASFMFIAALAYAQKSDNDFAAIMSDENNLQNKDAAAKDPVSEFRQYLQYAEKGNKKAMYVSGINYKNSYGTNYNPAEALKWFNKAIDAGYAPAVFKMGELYKFGDMVTMDYKKAFQFFSKAADMKHIPAYYSKGYMLHKGLGCSQNYEQACSLFKQASYLKYAPAMYMLGISFRNGFGVPANTDSAKYWLSIAKDNGYRFAYEELQTATPENNPTAIELLKKIKAAKTHAAPKSNPVNQYTKIPTGITSNELEGNYEGYLLKYDWSGKQVIDVTQLALQISYNNGKITGEWVENDSNLSVQINALLTKQGLQFKNMQYAKADHYSMGRQVAYKFESASLQLLNENNTYYLSGNIEFYSPMYREPEKPHSIVLVKTSSVSNNKMIAFVNEDGSLIQSKTEFRCYPNPFTEIINVEFELKKAASVSAQLLSIDGKNIISLPAGKLDAGKYILPMKTNVIKGTYIIKLLVNNQPKTVKVIKL